jgi:hypothetical protein
VVALRLAFGRDLLSWRSIDWVSVLAVALRERLAGVAWLRSGSVIRSLAPRDVVDRWRTLAVVIDQRGEARLGALTQALTALEGAGIKPIVLKGMPLSQRLYGNPFVRASDDIDLFIESADRTAATRALRASGWKAVEGKAPWDELFMLPDSSRTYLEVHEALVTDYLAHVRLPPPTGGVVGLAALRVRCFSGPLEPAYLAAHLAGHQLTPLLWGIDFLTLWSGLDEIERQQAFTAAGDVGLERYLQWAIGFASNIDSAANGDEGALLRLGAKGSDRADTHLSIWRHARLASSPLDAVRAVGACLWPRPLRWNVWALATRLAWAIRYRGRSRGASAQLRAEDVMRVAGGNVREQGHERRPTGIVRGSIPSAAGNTAASRSTADVADPRAGFKLAGPAMLEVVREAIAIAGFARVRAAGMSMWPTLGDGSLVTVVALPATLRPGQIVLMDWNGRPVLHRVVRVSGDTIVTLGDSNLQADPPTQVANVCALATSVTDGRGVVTLVGSFEHGVGSWLLYAAARSRLALARVWRRARGARW